MSARPSAPAVVFDDVCKSFVLPHERTHTLKERALHPLRRRSGEYLRALDHVSFEVEQGEFFGIVGRNGSGKSTLLKCLAGIYKVDQGKIWVNGRMATFIELGVGFNPDLAARDNVMINALMLGVPLRDARRRFDDIIAFAELEEFVDLKVKNYSSGMLVRLAFATAIQSDADILLIDEVLAVGDASFQQKCFDVFNQLKDEGRTILLVTHDMTSVRRFCHRAMLLDRGKIVTIDEPMRAAQQYFDLNFARDAASGSTADHWRAGATTIEEAWTEQPNANRVTTFLQTDECVLRVRVRFDEDLEDPHFNIVWLNEQGLSVFAVSTVSRPDGTGVFRAGDTTVVSVRVLPTFAPGRYTISMTVARQGSGEDVVERWHDMLSMLVTSPSAGGGLVDLPHELTIEHAGP